MATALAITAAVVGVGAAVAGGVVGTVSAKQEHEAAKAQAKLAEQRAQMEQQQIEYNKRQELREAAALEAETAENVRRQRLESEKLKSAQRAALGKSGAALTSGSPLAILGETAAEEEIKAQDLHYQGARAANAHYSQANIYGYQSKAARHNILSARAGAPSKSALGLNIAGSWTRAAGSAASSIGSYASYHKSAFGGNEKS